MDITIRYGERGPLEHASDKGETAAQVSGAGIRGRFGVVGNLGVSVAVDGWELRASWEDKGIDFGGVHGLHESAAETVFVFAAFDCSRILIGGKSVHRLIEALLVQRVDELGFSNFLDGRIRHAGVLRKSRWLDRF